MKQEKTESRFLLYDAPEELDPADRQLLLAAMEAAVTAYAPYSGFKVGAALRLESGVIVKGSNQENAVYPSGMCAERVAVFHASSSYPGVKIRSIAVAAFYKGDKNPVPASPCGDCRQVLAEYERLYDSDIRCIMKGDSHIIIAPSIRSLLPFLFSADQLRKNP